MTGVQNTYTSKYHIPNNLDETNENEDNEDITFFFDDSCFEFVNTTMNVRKSCNHAYFIIKIAHIRPPKQYLEEMMKYYPGGTWMTMTRRYEKEGVDKISIGYKLNKNKMLIFVLKKRVGEIIKLDSLTNSVMFALDVLHVLKYFLTTLKFLTLRV